MSILDPSVVRRRLTVVEPPLRVLFLVSLVESVGRGVFLSGNIVFFTVYTGLAPEQVALGISAAALAGFAASVVVGTLADRIGPRRLLITLLLLQAAGFATYPFISTAEVFYVVVVVVGWLEWGMGPTKGALVGTIVPPEQRVRTQAQLRTIFNIGFSVGSLLATTAALGRSALVLVPVVTAVMMLVAAAATYRLRPGSREVSVSRDQRRFRALRDARFLGVVALSTVQASHVTVLLVALPLWLLERTDLPRWVVPLTLIVNTAVVIAFQVRASRGAETVGGASRRARRSTVWFALACGLATLTASAWSVVALLALLLCVLVFSIAEIMQSAAGWGLAYGMAPDDAHGEYLGAFGLHAAAQGVLGPIVITTMLLTGGTWGWAALAAVVAASGLLLSPLTSGGRDPGAR